jgi:hypothetical protein
MDIDLDAAYDEAILETNRNKVVALDTSCSEVVALDASCSDDAINVVVLSDKKNNSTDIIKNILIHEFNNKFEFIDKIGMFNLLIRCIELMKNTDIKPENQCHASLEIIIHILETNALHITTPPRFITILALKHDIHKLAPLLNKIQEVMVMVDTLHSTLQTVLHAYLSA